jgi:hypothetical protein
MDPELFAQCHEQWLADQQKLAAEDVERQARWSRIEQLAITHAE